jgi:hypothetical protein
MDTTKEVKLKRVVNGYYEYGDWVIQRSDTLWVITNNTWKNDRCATLVVKEYRSAKSVVEAIDKALDKQKET